MAQQRMGMRQCRLVLASHDSKCPAEQSCNAVQQHAIKRSQEPQLNVKTEPATWAKLFCKLVVTLLQRSIRDHSRHNAQQPNCLESAF